MKVLRIEYYEQLNANKLDNLNEMDKIIEKQYIPTPNYEKIENLNTPTPSKSVTKSFQDKERSWTWRLHAYTKHLKKNVNASQILTKNRKGDFPGGPVAKNPPYNAGDPGSVPGWGIKILYSAGQLSLRAASPEPTLHNQRSCMMQGRSQVPPRPNAAKYFFFFNWKKGDYFLIQSMS